jgi:hypothetical protein
MSSCINILSDAQTLLAVSDSSPVREHLLLLCHVCRQVPEHWQQHIHTLQDAPFGRGPGQPSTAAERATESYLRMGRASSAGIDALAEAAAAALAAHPEVLEEHSRAAAAAAATNAATQPAAAAADAAGEQGQTAGGQATVGGKVSGCNKRVRQEQPQAGGAGGATGPAVAEAGLAPGRHEFKRPCTGAGENGRMLFVAVSFS